MFMRSIVLAAGALLVLGGCDNLSRTLGIDRQAPDEFQVLRHAPLSVPPNFRLRPPEPGAVRPQQAPPRERTRQALIGAAGGGSDPAARSAGETALLSKMDSAPVDDSFRRRIDEETAALAEKNSRLLDDLLFWKDGEPPASVVDAAAEQKRLQENAVLGKTPTEGETPTIERR